MLDAARLWRQFLGSSRLQASGMGLFATWLAFGFQAAAPATFAALDWSAYDVWLSYRAPIPVSPSLLIVTRDAASEAEFGTGPWDRAILARLLTSAREAGALAIGLDHHLDHASPAQRGGAASDALLLEALGTAAPVVIVQSADATLASDASIASHLSVASHSDHVARTVPAASTDGIGLRWHFSCIDLSWNASRKIVLRYNATCDAKPGETITNNATLTWTSLEGERSEERTGIGGANDYLRCCFSRR